MLYVSEFTIHKNEYLQYSGIIKSLYGFELETDLQILASKLIDGEYIAMSKFEPDVMSLLEDKQIRAYWDKYTDYKGILFIFGVLRFTDHYIIEVSELFDEIQDNEETTKHLTYTKKLRIELLKLWEFCENTKYKRQEDLEITIKISNVNRQIKLSNFDNYTLRVLKQFCIQHLPEYNKWDDAQKELAQYRRGGRPKDFDDTLTNNIIWGIYKLAQVVLKEKAKIGNGLCRFIYRYLQRVGLDPYSHLENEQSILKNLRKKIEIMETNNYRPSALEYDKVDYVFRDLYNDKM